MSEKHLAERLMYPLPDGWQDDSEQVAALKEIWPKIIAKNKELIDAEIASLRAQLDEVRRKAVAELIAIVAAFENPYVPPSDPPYGKGFIEGQNSTVTEIVKSFRALLSESKT